MRVHVSHLAAGMLALLMLAATAPSSSADDTGVALARIFEHQVTRRLTVPPDEQQHYASLLDTALHRAGIEQLPPEYVVLVDRNPRVQAAMIYWKSSTGGFEFIGATAVSTGLPGKYEHFETPVGVYDHVLDNPDFRSEGTLNEFGIRGYGATGQRIFDFGWVTAPKGWGDHGVSQMRLQLHATDPDILEPRLGSAQSKGCIRTNASFNAFVDRYGVLDGHYDRAIAAGQRFWVLSPERQATPWSGRYMVIVDSERETRPAWARPTANSAGARRTR
jgi:hypothetical protein